MAPMNQKLALELVATKHWKHSFEIVPGVVAKGDWALIDSSRMLTELYGLPKDLRGLTALDIGTLDGVHAFELERRGAQVTAIDIQNPDTTGFNTAKSIIESRVEYVQGSVYDLSKLFNKKFDIILFFGVWYHLKNPVRAFEEVAGLLTDSGTLCGEGEALIDYVEVDGQPQRGPAEQFARDMGASELPVSLYYPRQMKGDLWSWWVPNKACINAWLQTAGLEMTSHKWWHDYPHQRLHITARKNPQIEVTVDNPVW